MASPQQGSPEESPSDVVEGGAGLVGCCGQSGEISAWPACGEGSFRHAPRMVKKLLHTRMRVNDLERTVKFYEDALGLTCARRHTSPRGAQLAFLTTPNSEEEIEICQLANSPAVQVQPDLMHLAFEVEDLEAFATELKKKGYPLSDGPTKSGSGSVIAFIDAPEGYEVELIQRAK